MKKTFCISILSCLLCCLACTTKKKVGEVGTIGKIYHNTTARYNGYYNADVILTESRLILEEQSQDNYNKLLPLYPVTAAENPKAVASELDRAIEKVTVAGSLHEPSHWVDDCYVLMGKAQYLKQDFESAEETFEYFAEEYDPSNPLSRVYNRKDLKEKNDKIRKEQQEAERKQKEEERKRVREEAEEKRKADKRKREAENKAAADQRKREREDRERKRKDREEAAKKKTSRSDRRKKVKKTEETPVVETPKTETKPEPKKEVVQVVKEKELSEDENTCSIRNKKALNKVYPSTRV